MSSSCFSKGSFCTKERAGFIKHLFGRYKKEKKKFYWRQVFLFTCFSFLFMLYAVATFDIRFNNNSELSKYLNLLVTTINCILVILCIYKTCEEC